MHPDGGRTRQTVRTSRETFKNWFSRPGAHIVFEVGAHSRWVSELLTQLGHQVTIANPRRLKAISESDTKTDRRDAELLARLGRTDTRLLAPVSHRPAQAQADLVGKARDLLVSTRTKLINHIRGTIKSFGLRLPSCSSGAFARKTRDLVPPNLQPALRPIYDSVDCIDEQSRTHDRAIEGASVRYPEIDAISQIKRVGPLTALVFLLTIEDKHRFKSSRLVGAYLGLRPRKSQTGKDDPELGIAKAGDPFLPAADQLRQLSDWSFRCRLRPQTLGPEDSQARSQIGQGSAPWSQSPASSPS
jgi:transposase